MELLAHIREDGERQLLSEHLERTAKSAARFAASFGAAEWGKLAGELHDLGKRTDDFQRRIRGENIRVDHSTPGAKVAYEAGNIPAAFAIAGHHGGLPDGGSRLDHAEDTTLLGRLKRPTAVEVDSEPAKMKPPFSVRSGFETAFFTRMLYSCLVDADYLDTEEFMLGERAERGGYASVAELHSRAESEFGKWDTPESELNRKRSEILRRCRCGGEKSRGLYTLTVPTGGGKTTASLAFALSHALANGMERVIYVVPYTGIIEQNAKVFEGILGEENVVQHHSGVDWDEEMSGEAKRRRLSTENWDAPVIVTTAVQFFESLYAAKPSKCRKLHNIANSVVIFDEAQTIPVDYLRPCVAAMAELVRHYRSTVVLCTATQPSLGGMFREFAPELDMTELCPDAEADCFRRYTLERIPTLTEESLAEQLNEQTQVLCIVNTKASAQHIFSMMKPQGSFHLSTLMTPAHRSRVLDEIRMRLKTGGECRVVSTSLVEAGVDIDFPTVYREETGLDSILQAAGRCNREGRRPAEKSFVRVFRTDKPPARQFRQQIGVMQEIEQYFRDSDLAGAEAIAAYFTALFDIKTARLDKKEILKAFAEGIDGCAFPFRQVADKFRLIEQDTVPVVIPCEENTADIERLRRGEYSKTLLRRLGKHSVNVYRNNLRDLLDSGAVVRADESAELYILVNGTAYTEKIGLSLDKLQGEALFL